MRTLEEGPPDLSAGPLLDVWAKIDLRLESMAAAAHEQNRRRDQLRQAIHMVPVGTVQIPGSGTLDSPMILGPRAGFWWDVRRLTAAGFSAGTVAAYKNGVADGNQVFAFSSAGVITNGKAQVMLGPGDRLIYVSSNITLNTGAAGVSIGGDAIQVEAWALFDYLV